MSDISLNNSRLDNKFSELKKANQKALIPFITCGDPDLDTTHRLVLALEENGADIVELGVPFSDPLADGPTIQKSSQRALDRGVNPDIILETVTKIRQNTQIPLVFMIYYNIILQMGEETFVKKAVSAGVDGIIVPDLPLEESGSLMAISREHGLDLVLLLAPTSTEDRVSSISLASMGFIYYVSITGVTGARKNLKSSVKERVEKIKSVSKKPVCVGFGISTAEQAKEVSAWADGVVVGSALVNIISEANNPQEAVMKAGLFVKSLKDAIS